MTKVNKFWLVVIFIFLADLLTKLLALRIDFFTNSIVQNPGLPFGINLPGFFNSAVAVVLSVAFLFFYFKYFSLDYSPAALGLIIGGAAANIFDRLWDGKVVDFIDIGISTVNLADIGIMAGIAALALNAKFKNQNAK